MSNRPRDLAELLDRIGRCESCGRFVPEDELIALTQRGSPELLVCVDCYAVPPMTRGDRDD